MFSSDIYIRRREHLKKQVGSGVILFLGNDESPMNYAANTFSFRQDSSFLYFFGLDFPGLAAVIDIDNDREILFGYDYTIDDIVWMGPQQTMQEKAHQVGVRYAEPTGNLADKIKKAIQGGQRVHFLPQYRAENTLKIERLTGIQTWMIKDYASTALIKAVVAQRSVKSAAEIAEIESALALSSEMYQLALQIIKPGRYEKEVAGAVEGLLLSKGSAISFPVIFTIHGEILHGHSHENLMQAGQMVVLDSGAESPRHYASDITRTFPVSGKFTPLQRDIYQVVLAAQEQAIAMMQPGVRYKEVHLHAARVIANGMKQLGFMKGNTDDAVAAGAHALFFPHGLGHMLGLDVHDMEGLGENLIGYDDEVQRSDQFGLAYLRFGKKLAPGYVLTVEPGIYFMPQLIDLWKSQQKYTEFINYDKIEANKSFGGIRIEDDVLMTTDGHRVLGPPIPKSVAELASMAA